MQSIFERFDHNRQIFGKHFMLRYFLKRVIRFTRLT